MNIKYKKVLNYKTKISIKTLNIVVINLINNKQFNLKN